MLKKLILSGLAFLLLPLMPYALRADNATPISATVATATPSTSTTPIESDYRIPTSLKGLTLDAAVLEPTVAGQNTDYILNYQYHGAFNYFNKSNWINGVTGQLDATGSLATDPSRNPNDLENFDFSLSYFLSGNYQKLIDGLKNKKADLMNCHQNYVNDDTLDKCIDNVNNSIGYFNRVYTSLGLTGGLETDQEMNRSQFAYGLKIGFDYSVNDPDSVASKCAIFEYPFSVFRYLDGTSTSGNPLPGVGHIWPTVLLTLDRLSPQNTSTAEIDGSENPTRASCELSYQSTLGNRLQANIELDWRFYCMLGQTFEAPQSEYTFSYFLVKATMPSKVLDGIIPSIISSNALPTNLFLEYADGRLPLDVQNSSTVSAGITKNF